MKGMSDYSRLTDEERKVIREMSDEDRKLFSSVEAGGDYGIVDLIGGVLVCLAVLGLSITAIVMEIAGITN